MPNSPGLIRRAWKAWAVVVGIGWVAVAVSSAMIRLGGQNDPLSRWSYDLASRWRPAEKTARVMLLEITPTTTANLGQPVPRRHFGDLLDLARRSGVRLVFFDLVFWQRQSPEDDSAFAKALHSFPAAMLGDGLKRIPTDAGIITDQPSSPVTISHLQAVASLTDFRLPERCGLLDFEPDPDGSIRRLYGGFQNKTHPDYLTAAWNSAALLLTNHLKGPYRERWLRYYGPAGTVFPRRELSEVLNKNALPTGTELIFVGVNQDGNLSTQNRETRDLFPGPYPGDSYGGFELHATAVLNLLQGEALTRWHPLFQLLAVSAWGTLVVALVAKWKSAWIQVVIVLLALLSAFLFVRLGWWLNHWWPWLIPVALQSTVALIVSAWIPDPPLGRPRVFISYHANQSGETYARGLEQALRIRRIPAYVAPGNIAGGTAFPDALSEAIQQARNFLLVLTPAARLDLQDPATWVRRELTWAHESRKRILIVRTRGESAEFSEDQVKDPPGLLRKLAEPTNALERFLHDSLSPATRNSLAQLAAQPSIPTRVFSEVASDLRRVLRSGPLYREERFVGLSLSPATRQLLQRPSGEVDPLRLNFLLLQDAFPGELYGEAESVAPADLSFLTATGGAKLELHQVEYDPGKGFERAMKEIVDGLR